MIYTSYFGNICNLPDNFTPIANLRDGLDCVTRGWLQSGNFLKFGKKIMTMIIIFLIIIVK